MTTNSLQDPQDLISAPPNTNENTAPTSDPLDPFRDHPQLREMIRVEEASGGEVGAGRDW